MPEAITAGPSEVLLNLAEVAVTFAGFASIVAISWAAPASGSSCWGS